MSLRSTNRSGVRQCVVDVTFRKQQTMAQPTSTYGRRLAQYGDVDLARCFVPLAAKIVGVGAGLLVSWRRDRVADRETLRLLRLPDECRNWGTATSE